MNAVNPSPHFILWAFFLFPSPHVKLQTDDSCRLSDDEATCLGVIRKEKRFVAGGNTFATRVPTNHGGKMERGLMVLVCFSWHRATEPINCVVSPDGSLIAPHTHHDSKEEAGGEKKKKANGLCVCMI